MGIFKLFKKKSKLSEDLSKNEKIQHLLYDWEKSGKIQRRKVGNTYKITL